MGEESAGVDAVRIALSRIQAGQSDIALVGGSFNAERRDILLLFEAGAISKVKGAHVCTLLLGLEPGEVAAPLNQFQSTTFDKGDVYRLLQALNAEAAACGERSLAGDKLQAVFDNNWQRLNERVAAIGAQRPLPEDTDQTMSRTLVAA